MGEDVRFVARGRNSCGSKRRSHRRPDCPNLSTARNVGAKTREVVRIMGLAACGICDPEAGGATA